MWRRIFISLVVATALIISTSLQAKEETKEIKARWIELGEKAEFSGMLVPEKQFNEATIQMLDLKLCEKRLREKNCGDSLEKETASFYTAVGLFLGGIAVGVIARDL